MITLEGLWHSYGEADAERMVLEPLTLSIPQSQFLAILGSSGCGKSTLLRIVAGLLPARGGKLSFARSKEEEPTSRPTTGWLAQEDALFPWRTVTENVALALRQSRESERTRYQRVAGIVSRVGLTDSANRYPHQLSGGMRQRASLARALVAEPSLLLLDEPFSQLDELTRERLGRLLLEVRASTQPTTVLVTHSVSEAVRLADRVLVLSALPGRVLRDTLIKLPHPRSELQQGFGELVYGLKAALQEDARDQYLEVA